MPAVRILARSTSPAANTYAYAPLVTMTAPSREDFRAQTQLVRNYADLRSERIPEIIAQSDDLLSFFGAIDYIDRNRARWTIELVEASLRLAVIVEQRMKHALNCPRPMLFSDQIQPIIQTPGHAALPSGHATEAFTIATVLTHLFETANAVNEKKKNPPLGDFFTVPNFTTLSKDKVKDQTQRYRLAARIAINRTVAGVHYPVDSAAGAVLGITLGEYVVARCCSLAKTRARSFDGTKYGPLQDFELNHLFKILTMAGPVQDLALPLDGKSAHLREVWRRAVDETRFRWGQ